jgi:hypothetical protein
LKINTVAAGTCRANLIVIGYCIVNGLPWIFDWKAVGRTNRERPFPAARK